MKNTTNLTTKWFSITSGIILLFTGLAKLLSSCGNSRILDLSDPVFYFSFRDLLVFIGLLEVGIALICIFSRKYLLSATLVTWLGTNFLIYRYGLHFLGWTKPCPCLGNFSDELKSTLHISPGFTGLIANCALVYFLAGGYMLFIISWIQSRENLRTKKARLGQELKSHAACLVGIIFACVFSPYAKADNLATSCIEGSATWKIHRIDGSVQQTYDYYFKVLVSHGGWRIDLTPADAGKSPVISVGSDNADTYQFLNNDYISNEKTVIQGRSVTNSLTQLGSVCGGPFPLDGTKEVQILWMSFLYSYYHTNASIPDPVVLSGIHYQVLNGATLSVDFYSSDVLQKAKFISPGLINRDDKIIKLRPPLDDGFTLWSIEVLATTNTSFGIFPLAVTYYQYLPISGTNLFNQWVAEISVTNIETLKDERDRLAFMPVVTNKNLMTFDYRFTPGYNPAGSSTSIPITMYYVYDGNWLSSNQALEYKNGYQEVRKNVKEGKISGSYKYRPIVWCFFGITSIALLLIVWKQKNN